MLDNLISLVAPHPCFSCGALGANLCDYCKYDIENEYFTDCVLCGKLANKNGICATCHPPYSRAWCVGERSGVLSQLIDSFKFHRNYAAHKDLAALLSDCVGVLPPNAVIVPIPTLTSHRRRRGYDHTLLLAKALSHRQEIPVTRLLRRASATTQRGNNKGVRELQAARAFIRKGLIDENKVYVIIDDITTTGATLHHAAKLLCQAGAKDVWVAVIARQPLD